MSRCDEGYLLAHASTVDVGKYHAIILGTKRVYECLDACGVIGLVDIGADGLDGVLATS